MKKPRYTLGVGPMSQETIQAVYTYSQANRVPLMLIASRNQVDYASGYVATTKEFVTRCKKLQKQYPNADILLCRDHCGPGFNGDDSLTSVYQTIDTDIQNGFDLIHIDFCHLKNGDILHESKKAIEYILRKNPKINIEIGTESNGSNHFLDIKKVEKEMAYFSAFSPMFFVCQTGSLTKEIDQVGTFNKPYVTKLAKLATKYQLVIKEHNADYLSAQDIQQRRGLVGAMNIAPNMGVLQTLFTLEKAKLYGIDITHFLEVAYKSAYWKKWLSTNTSDNKMLCSSIAGHCCFKTKAYERIVKEINKQENFYEAFEKEVHKLLNLYIINFSS